MHLITHLDLLRTAEQTLARSCRLVSDHHRDDAAVHFTLARFADQCDELAAAVDVALASRPTERQGPSPERLHPDGLDTTRGGAFGLLRDLLDLYQLASLVDISWSLVGQAARGDRDRDLIRTADRAAAQTGTQLAWLTMIMSSAAPQTLLVAD